jgi:tetratricopeptide (TPR) repeat protein
MSDLGLEYLKEIENQPLSENDKKAIPLERAKCLLEAAEDEADEGTRTGLVAEAKEGFNDFLNKSGNHPRASEASLALARLASIEAKTQLNKARRIDPGDDEDLKKQQKAESEAARPLFKVASKLFGDAAQQIKTKLEDKTLDPATRATLTREAFEAELAAAINQYNLADTYLATDAKTTIEKSNALEEARKKFAELARGSNTGRTAWIAKAWMAETLMGQGKPNDAETEFKAILAATQAEAEDGKRLVRFFQTRRNYFGALSEKTPTRIQASEREIRAWLSRYGSSSKPTPETIAFRFYLAFLLRLQADNSAIQPKTGAISVGETARRQYAEAEKLFRILSQTDNDYTTRASKFRMQVVRMLLGEADQPTSAYSSFETAQMAALIQMSKLSDVEKGLPALTAKVKEALENKRVIQAVAAELRRGSAEASVRDRKYRIMALLERARELATDKDSPGDVADNLLRLVYYYMINNQPLQAAVLGEHVSKTIRSNGGKAATAGLMAVNGYVKSAQRIKVDSADPDNKEKFEAAMADKKNDRDRAMQLAQFLDEKFPNDAATDAVRHLLASMLMEEKKTKEAFEMIIKVRPGYAQAAAARQLEGFLAAQLITTPAKDMPLPPGGKPAVFRRAVADLDRVVKPSHVAREEDVRSYLSVRARLALLYLAQTRAEDKEADKAGPGYERALKVADEMIAAIPTFDCLKEGEGSANLNLTGLEMKYLVTDARVRALYLRGKTLVDSHDPADLDKAAVAIDKAIADIGTKPLYDDKMKEFAGTEGNDSVAAQKVKVAGLAQNIDQTQKNIIMLGFKLRVRQGKPPEANKMLDLLFTIGGTVEENQGTLEFMARDLAAQIAPLKKAGQVNEAKAMGDGLAELLKRLSSIPNRATASNLFLGQTLYMVEKFDDALAEFNKVKVPVPPAGAQAAVPAGTPAPKATGAPKWWEVDVNKLENNPEKKTFQDQVRDYRLAQLYTARSLRGASKFDDCEKLLVAAIGTSDKQGYAYGSLDFRKELAMMYEARGASKPDPKVAKDDWGKALKEWTTLATFASNGVSRLKGPTPEQERQAKNHFFEAYLEVQRCLIQANQQLLKGNPKLADSYTDVGKKILGMETNYKFAEREKAGDGLILPEVWSHYCDLLDKIPELKNGYRAAGGKFFLERPKD